MSVYVVGQRCLLHAKAPIGAMWTVLMRIFGFVSVKTSPLPPPKPLLQALLQPFSHGDLINATD